MKIPDYPSNREADEAAYSHCLYDGKTPPRMKPSRETCLHYFAPGVENRFLFFSLALPREGRFFIPKSQTIHFKKIERRIHL